MQRHANRWGLEPQQAAVSRNNRLSTLDNPKNLIQSVPWMPTARKNTKKQTRRQPSDPNILTPKQVGDLLAVSGRTLEMWRRNGKGPAFSKEGRCVRYLRSDIDQWMRDRKGRSVEEFKPFIPGGRR